VCVRYGQLVQQEALRSLTQQVVGWWRLYPQRVEHCCPHLQSDLPRYPLNCPPATVIVRRSGRLVVEASPRLA
jgi:hypothetical protein